MSKRDPIITSKIMSKIRSKNTKPEIMIRRLLWEKGYRYRVHYRIKGKPDIVFIRKRVAIFIDGDFWHGNNWRLRGFESSEDELNTYSEFWRNKILRNIERDESISKELRDDGWVVLRYWESEIKKNPKIIVEEIISTL